MLKLEWLVVIAWTIVSSPISARAQGGLYDDLVWSEKRAWEILLRRGFTDLERSKATARGPLAAARIEIKRGVLKSLEELLIVTRGGDVGTVVPFPGSGLTPPPAAAGLKFTQIMFPSSPSEVDADADATSSWRGLLRLPLLGPTAPAFDGKAHVSRLQKALEFGRARTAEHAELSSDPDVNALLRHIESIAAALKTGDESAFMRAVRLYRHWIVDGALGCCLASATPWPAIDLVSEDKDSVGLEESASRDEQEEARARFESHDPSEADVWATRALMKRHVAESLRELSAITAARDALPPPTGNGGSAEARRALLLTQYAHDIRSGSRLFDRFAQARRSGTSEWARRIGPPPRALWSVFYVHIAALGPEAAADAFAEVITEVGRLQSDGDHTLPTSGSVRAGAVSDAGRRGCEDLSRKAAEAQALIRANKLADAQSYCNAVWAWVLGVPAGRPAGSAVSATPDGVIDLGPFALEAVAVMPGGKTRVDLLGRQLEDATLARETVAEMLLRARIQILTEACHRVNNRAPDLERDIKSARERALSSENAGRKDEARDAQGHVLKLQRELEQVLRPKMSEFLDELVKSGAALAWMLADPERCTAGPGWRAAADAVDRTAAEYAPFTPARGAASKLARALRDAALAEQKGIEAAKAAAGPLRALLLAVGDAAPEGAAPLVSVLDAWFSDAWQRECDNGHASTSLLDKDPIEHLRLEAKLWTIRLGKPSFDARIRALTELSEKSRMVEAARAARDETNVGVYESDVARLTRFVETPVVLRASLLWALAGQRDVLARVSGERQLNTFPNRDRSASTPDNYGACPLKALFGEAADPTIDRRIGDLGDDLRAFSLGWARHHPGRESLLDPVAALRRDVERIAVLLRAGQRDEAQKELDARVAWILSAELPDSGNRAAGDPGATYTLPSGSREPGDREPFAVGARWAGFGTYGNAKFDMAVVVTAQTENGFRGRYHNVSEKSAGYQLEAVKHEGGRLRIEISTADGRKWGTWSCACSRDRMTGTWRAGSNGGALSLSLETR